eukprot:5864088-Prymnesium_polylepis.1
MRRIFWSYSRRISWQSQSLTPPHPHHIHHSEDAPSCPCSWGHGGWSVRFHSNFTHSLAPRLSRRRADSTVCMQHLLSPQPSARGDAWAALWPLPWLQQTAIRTVAAQ